MLTVATTEIFNVVAMDQLRAMLGTEIEIKTQLAAEAQLEDYIDQFYGYELSVDGILKEIETGEIDYESLQAGGDEYTQPMVRLVNALLVDAVKRGASDIHFEPEYAFLRVRFRIDGVLETVRSLHKTYMPGITVRIKVVSDMNIAETRAPQDGRLSLTLNGRPVDFRVSTQPTIYGENIVLRVLDREKSIISLDRMNLPSDVTDKLGLMLARPEGILIVTGPTGSGKTTTLYSLLAQVNDETVNIMTLEDPVEYPLTLMRQTSVNEVARMDFANGIRSIMRQDPDIILVGEVRDKETAEMAFRAAMTGHQVFTTLHTNSALGVFPRLLDIGIQPDIMAGNIIGVIAQRLVRMLCPHCKEAYSPSARRAAACSATRADEVATLYRPVGCRSCDNKGYKGRTRDHGDARDGCRHGRARRAARDCQGIAHRRPGERLPSARRSRTAARRRRDHDARRGRARRRSDGPLTSEAASKHAHLPIQSGRQTASPARRPRSGQRSRPRAASAPNGARPHHVQTVDRGPRFVRSRTRPPGHTSGPHQLLFRHGADEPLRDPAARRPARSAQLDREPALRDVLTVMIEDMEGGKVLSQCMAAHPEVFNKVFVSLVGAGEQTGRLPEVFQSLAESLKWQDELASQTRRLLIYPAIVMLVVMAVVVFLLVYLVPQVSATAQDDGHRAADSDAGADRRVECRRGMVAAHLRQCRSSRPASFDRDDGAQRSRSIPLGRREAAPSRSSGTILQKIILARFATFFALMYESGITVLEAMRTSEDDRRKPRR